MDLNRLYRQAQNGASDISKLLTEAQVPFLRPFELLGLPNTLPLNSLEDLTLLLGKTYKLLQQSCKSLEPYYTIPLLIEFTSLFYSNSISGKSNWGAPAKLCCTLIWDNINHPDNSNYKSHTLICESIQIAGFYLFLDHLRNHWGFYNFSDLILTAKGIPLTNEMYSMQVETELQGRHEYKTLTIAIKEIWLQLDDVIKKTNLIALLNIIPSLLFKGTFLENVRSSIFWNKFWALLTILKLVFKTKLEQNGGNRDQIDGLVLLPKTLILAVDNMVFTHTVQKSVEECFWQNDWYEKKLKQGSYEWVNCIIERPLLRIMSSEHYFATSYLYMQDSINGLIENLVLAETESHLFEQYISRPFELEVAEIFNQHGFISGEVTVAGSWIIPGSSNLLENTKRMPGQIDVLAQKQDVVIIVDCKALKFPNTTRKIRNLRSKVGDNDDEAFHSKLKKKVAWIKETSRFKNKNVYALIIVDRFIPGSLSSRYLTLTITQLASCLELNLPFDNWQSHVFKQTFSTINLKKS